MVKVDAFAAADHFGKCMSQWIETYVTAGGEQARLPGSRGSALEHEACAREITLSSATEQELRRAGFDLASISSVSSETS